MSIFYIPADGYAADFIPFHHQGAYHLFYLKDYRNKAEYGEGISWFHLETRDFLNITEHGEAIPHGAVDEQDLFVFTGSVIEKDGVFHTFYTGHNPHMREKGKPEQAILHATSADLLHWTRDAEFKLSAPEQNGYEPHDWRDPFVFWNEEDGEYWMLITARRKKGPSRQRGLIALMASGDLRNWEMREPFWEPHLYYAHEVPDVFRIGDWWYLLYSTFSERFVTHYRMSKSPKGPWVAPPNDTFDARAYYAAKTAGDGNRRFSFGWLATRSDEKDDGVWNWGGNLVVHEIEQKQNGLLTVKAPKELLAAFQEPVSTNPREIIGKWAKHDRSIIGDATAGSAVMRLGELPRCCLVECELTFSENTTGAGLLFHADENLDNYYQLRIEPANNRLVFDRWPRPGDQPFMLERPLGLSPGTPTRLRIIIDSSCVVAYANDSVALSCRMYKHQSGELGLFVTEGKAEFRVTSYELSGNTMTVK